MPLRKLRSGEGRVIASPKPEIDIGTPAVDLTRRMVDMTAGDIVEIIDARLALFLEGGVQRPGDDSLLDRAGAAQFLKCSTAQIDLLCREQGLPFRRCGDVKRFDREEIRAWWKAQAAQ